MALISGNGHSDAPIRQPPKATGTKKEIGRASPNYHPSVWGDRFAVMQLEEMEVDALTQQRAKRLKEEVKKMLQDASGARQELELINEIQRLGVGYHFGAEIENALDRIHNARNNDNDDDLHVVALRFRLLRQEGYNESSDVFKKFKGENGEFKAALRDDVRGLLSLYEAAYFRTNDESILDEAIDFTTKNLKSMLPHLSSPLSELVKLALDTPLLKRIERLQSRLFISIYQQEERRTDLLLEFAKLDFNILQALHKKELSELSRWWKENDFATKLPFIRDRLAECYFWILGVYYEPHYSRARRMTATIISLISIMDDIYDVYGRLEELELYTATIERWDREAMDRLPDYMKVHFNAFLAALEKFEEELSEEGEYYRISYLKKSCAGLAKAYLEEARWANAGYVPTVEEYMKIALVSCGYLCLTVTSFVGMGEIATKEAFEWAINMPNIVKASSLHCRLIDDINSNQLEQERVHVASVVHCYMKEYGTTYEETCEHLKEKAENAWRDINKECMKPIPVPREVIKRPVNLTRVIEVIHKGKDMYTDSTVETKEWIRMLLIDPLVV